MPYRLPDGRTINGNQAFELNDVRYPSNWLRLSTDADRAALGIVWEDDPPTYDRRFYSGYADDGSLIPLDHASLVKAWAERTRRTANGLLSASDWMVVRQADNGTAMPTEWGTWRESIRTASAEKVAAIEATADTDALAIYIRGSEYMSWNPDPSMAAET